MILKKMSAVLAALPLVLLPIPAPAQEGRPTVLNAYGPDGNPDISIIDSPLSVQDRLASAVLAMENGSLKASFDSLQLLAALDSTDAAIFYYRGRCLQMMALAGGMDSGEMSSAGLSPEADFRRAIALDGTNTDYYDTLISFLELDGRALEAAHIYDSLIVRFPHKYCNTYVLTSLADAALYLDNDSLAVNYFGQALAIDPDYAPAVLGLADAYRARGNVPAYFRELEKFVRSTYTDPSFKCRYVNRVIGSIDARFYRSWHVQLDSLVALCANVHPSDSACLKFAGRWFYGTDRKDRGTAYFARYLECYPRSIEAHSIMQQIYLEREDLDAVWEQAAEIVAIAREDGDIDSEAQQYTLLGDICHLSGRLKECYDFYDASLELKPDDPNTLNNFAYYILTDRSALSTVLAGSRRKRIEKALEMSRRAVELVPDNASYLDTYGWALHLSGRDEDAKLQFKRAMMYDGKDSAVVLYHYGIVLRELGDTKLADYYLGLAKDKTEDDK